LYNIHSTAAAASSLNDILTVVEDEKEDVHKD
jgi:hypothetical protein